MALRAWRAMYSALSPMPHPTSSTLQGRAALASVGCSSGLAGLACPADVAPQPQRSAAAQDFTVQTVRSVSMCRRRARHAGPAAGLPAAVKGAVIHALHHGCLGPANLPGRFQRARHLSGWVAGWRGGKSR